LTGPNPLNSSSAKTLFYTFHVLPEWLAVCILFSENVRKTFGTGMLGDWRIKDETEKQKTKRLAKEAAEEAKKKRIWLSRLMTGDVDENENELLS